MKTILTASFLLIAFTTFAQVKFEAGYIIQNDGTKVECLIFNKDWKDNPTSIRVKLPSDEEIKNFSIEDLQEFSVSYHRYVRVDAKMDKSSQDVKRLSGERAPDWEDRRAFLKVLVDGKADLLYFSESGRRLFFFRVGDNPIEQLIFKYYLTTASITLRNGGNFNPGGLATANSNLTYINQLNTQVSCPTVAEATPKNISYERHALVKYFSNYNKCSSEKSINYDDAIKPEVHVTIRPGLNFTSLQNYFDPINQPTSWGAGPRVGVEFELRLAVNKRKWGILLEPTYQSFEKKNPSSVTTYESIELPVSMRHYFFLTDHTQLFANAGIEMDIAVDCSITGNNGFYIESTLARSVVHGAFGAGVAHRKLSLETRYHSRRDFDIFTAVKTSVILGYRIR